MSSLKIIKVGDLGAAQKEPDWLIKGLWLDGGVGLIGGEPKSYKTFAALSLAVSVASGCECFHHYQVPRQGPVLLYAAEDSLAMVRARVAGIAQASGCEFTGLDIHVIAEPQLRIDVDFDRQRLAEAIGEIKPVLLVLDPFVRLHGKDENSSADVAGILSWLRHLQRQFNMNVVMVHHARKRAGKERPGQSLRGSSELHAWGDSNLYLRRVPDEDHYIELTIEHRAAPSQGNIRLRFAEADEGPYLVYEGCGIDEPKTLSNNERILAAFRDGGDYQTGETLRKSCGIRSAALWKGLKEMVAAGQIEKSGDNRYRAVSTPEC